MEQRVQSRLQIPADNFLRDAVRHRWYTQRPRPARRLRNVHPPHRLREIASRRQSIPELVEIVHQINLKVCDRLPIYSSRSSVGLHFLEGLPDFPLRDVKRRCLGHVAPPVSGWPPVLGGLPQSLRSSPITEPSSLLRTAPSLCPHRYSCPCRDLPLELLPYQRSDRFPRSTKEPDLDSRHLQAGCRSSRTPRLRPNSSQGPLPSPQFRHRPVNFGTSSAVRLRSSLQISPDRIYFLPFPATLTTNALNASSSQWFGAAPDRRLRGTSPHLFCSPHLLCSWTFAAHVVGQFEIILGKYSERSELFCEHQVWPQSLHNQADQRISSAIRKNGPINTNGEIKIRTCKRNRAG